jgi:hypothetical protein
VQYDDPTLLRTTIVGRGNKARPYRSNAHPHRHDARHRAGILVKLIQSGNFCRVVKVANSGRR